MGVERYDWADQQVIDLAGWNPKLHPRGWGGRFGISTKAPASRSPGVKYTDHNDISSEVRHSRAGFGVQQPPPLRTARVQAVKPKTKKYSRADARAVQGIPSATEKVVARVRPATSTRVMSKAVAGTKRESPIQRVQPETQLPSRVTRAKLKAGARVAGAQRQFRSRVAAFRERRANKPPRFKAKEYVSIAAVPAERTMADRFRNREAQGRIGQVVSKRGDGKYIVRTVDGNRDVHEAIDPSRMTLIKQNAGDPAPLRPSRELNTRQKIQRARRVWTAYKDGMNG